MKLREVIGYELASPRKPALAGIDLYHVLDWEEHEDDNNIEKVKIGNKDYLKTYEKRKVFTV